MSLLLIACICLFISLSCSYAIDIDNATSDNQSTMVLDDDAGISQNMTMNQTPSKGTCSMSKISTDLVIRNHVGSKDGSDFSRYNDFRHKSFSKLNDSIEDSSLMDLETDNAMFDYNYNVDKEFALESSPNTMTISVEKVVNKDTFQNICYDIESLNGMASYDGMTSQADFCMCGDRHCDHEGIIHSNRIIDGDHINEDFEHFYNSIYIQLNVVCCEVAMFRDVKKGDDDENQCFNEVFIFNGAHDMNQSEDEDVLGGFNSLLDMGLDACLVDSVYWNFTKFGCMDFDIDMLHCNYLDINDVYLEYYIFTNPDIISIESLNIDLLKFNTTIFKNSFYHCPAFDLKNIIHFFVDSSDIFHNNYVQYISAYFLEKTIPHICGHFISLVPGCVFVGLKCLGGFIKC